MKLPAKFVVTICRWAATSVAAWCATAGFTGAASVRTQDWNCPLEYGTYACPSGCSFQSIAPSVSVAPAADW